MNSMRDVYQGVRNRRCMKFHCSLWTLNFQNILIVHILEHRTSQFICDDAVLFLLRDLNIKYISKLQERELIEQGERT